MAKTEIQTEVSLNTTKFQRGLAKSQKGINNFASNAIKKFGAIAGAAGLGMLARSAIDLGSKISDMAVQMNIGTTELQVLDFAAREAGVGTEIMARALRNVQLRTEEAIKGNKSYGDAFVQLGINVNEFKKLKTEEKMEAIAIAQSKATDKAAAYNAVSRILGEKAGPALQEVLQNLAGPQGYGGLEAAAKRAGEVMSKETIAKMDAAADKIESFKRQMTVLAAEVLAKVISPFQMLGNGLGFIGDMVGVAASNALSFGQALGSVISAVVAPAIKQFNALGFAIKAAGQVAKRDFAGAKESLIATKEAAGDSVDAIKAIPDEIGAAFNRLKSDGEAAMEVLGDSLEKRADNIGKAWTDLTGGMVEDTKDAAGKINNTSITPGGTTGGKTSKAVAAVSKKAEKPADKPLFRKFGESLAKFDPTSGERRKMGESFKHLDVQKKLSDAKGGDTSEKKAAATEQYAKESAESLEVIKEELTRSSR